MDQHPRFPGPASEMTPRELVDRIEAWSNAQGYAFQFRRGTNEYGVITVRDTVASHTKAVMPNPHHGRRLRKDQVRYVIKEINTSWKS